MISSKILIPPHYEMKMKILASVLDLFNECKFEDLTVKAVCDRAGITRPTFYRYFSDKYEVLQWHFDLTASKGIFEIGRSLNWQQGYLHTMQEQYNLKDLYHHAAYSKGYHSVPRYVERMRIENLKETLTDYVECELEQELLFQIAAIALLESTLITRWMRDEMKEEPLEMAELMISSVPPRLYALLNTGAYSSLNKSSRTVSHKRKVLNQSHGTNFDIR